jgi:NADH-quinone oxidoreductase subunit E
MGVLSERTRREFEALLARYPVKRSAVIPCLHLAQAEVGYLSPAALEEVAAFLGLPPVQVMEVATFYDMFHLEPIGRHLVYVCHNVSCALLGAERLLRHIQERWGVRSGQTTGDGLFTLRRMECLAACGEAPAIQIDGQYHGRVTPQRFDALVAGLRDGRG